MDELVRWLGEQLDEDERIARAATDRQPYDEWDAVGAGDDDDAARSHWEVVKIARMSPTPAARSLAMHIAAHDPARVLREINAKRQVLTRYAELVDRVKELSAIRDRLSAQGRSTVMTDGELESAIHQRDALLGVLRLLALPYADRPTYREEWAP